MFTVHAKTAVKMNVYFDSLTALLQIDCSLHPVLRPVQYCIGGSKISRIYSPFLSFRPRVFANDTFLLRRQIFGCSPLGHAGKIEIYPRNSAMPNVNQMLFKINTYFQKNVTPRKCPYMYE